MRRIVRNLLKELGFTNVEEAEDGAAALSKLRQGGFEVVVSDWNMPNMDGLTLIKSLRATPQYKTVPILMLTTESGEAMKAQGRAAGATGWLVKPFDPQKLLEVVKKVIG
jgi:two-component system chemotaxis response regulator CheY